MFKYVIQYIDGNRQCSKNEMKYLLRPQSIFVSLVSQGDWHCRYMNCTMFKHDINLSIEICSNKQEMNYLAKPEELSSPSSL